MMSGQSEGNEELILNSRLEREKGDKHANDNRGGGGNKGKETKTGGG